ncbi:MAG: sigma-70 family RNA polymerase sigma factor [Syntrophomonadaceae bacterium]
MESVQQLYMTYEQYIFRYLYSLTLDYHRAEELTQETFLRVVRALPRFRGDAHVSTWLYGIARNVYLESIKKNPLWFSLNDEKQKDPGDRGLRQQLEDVENGLVLRDILKNLPDNQREVLLLRDWQGFSYEEIAIITGHTIAWVKTTIFRARKAFRAAYIKEETL